MASHPDIPAWRNNFASYWSNGSIYFVDVKSLELALDKILYALHNLELWLGRCDLPLRLIKPGKYAGMLTMPRLWDCLLSKMMLGIVELVRSVAAWTS
jgi:hypothetical protein